MVQGQRGTACLDAPSQVAVHVALAEARKSYVLFCCPADEAAKLHLVVALGLFGAGGLKVETELIERLVPGETLRTDFSLRTDLGRILGANRGRRGKADDICDRFASLLIAWYQQQQGG